MRRHKNVEGKDVNHLAHTVEKRENVAGAIANIENGLSGGL